MKAHQVPLSGRRTISLPVHAVLLVKALNFGPDASCKSLEPRLLILKMAASKLLESARRPLRAAIKRYFLYLLHNQNLTCEPKKPPASLPERAMLFMLYVETKSERLTRPPLPSRSSSKLITGEPFDGIGSICKERVLEQGTCEGLCMSLT